MRKTVGFLCTLFGLVLLVALHVGASYILPYPWSKINLIFVALITLIMVKESGITVWASFFAHFIIELFTTTPFGVVLTSGTLAILCGYWLFQSFFTNRSVYATIALTALCLSIYRVLYIIILSALFLLHIVKSIPWKLILFTSAWELCLTTLSTAIVYLVVSKLSQKHGMALLKTTRFRL